MQISAQCKPKLRLVCSVYRDALTKMSDKATKTVSLCCNETTDLLKI